MEGLVDALTLRLGVGKHKAKCHPNRRHFAKGECRPCYDKNRPDAKSRGIKHYRKFRANTTPEQRRLIWLRARLKHSYGITLEQYEEMLLRQDYKCAMCHSLMRRPCVDHDHKTGKVRGLLHGKCNLDVGLWEKRQPMLKLAEKYLREATRATTYYERVPR